MPKTAVNKYGQSLFWENKVGLAWEWLVSSPSLDAVLFEELKKFYFRGFVTLSTNVGHHLAPFGFGEYVRHSYY